MTSGTVALQQTADGTQHADGRQNLRACRERRETIPAVATTIAALETEKLCRRCLADVRTTTERLRDGAPSGRQPGWIVIQWLPPSPMPALIRHHATQGTWQQNRSRQLRWAYLYADEALQAALPDPPGYRDWTYARLGQIDLPADPRIGQVAAGLYLPANAGHEPTRRELFAEPQHALAVAADLIR